jgi:hypothetical protein
MKIWPTGRGMKGKTEQQITSNHASFYNTKKEQA